MKHLIYFVIFFLYASNIFAQGYLHTEGKKIVDGAGNEILLRSMGLGGWMLQEPYMMQWEGAANTHSEFKSKLEEFIGVENSDSFYIAWLNNHCRKIDVDSMASWGFNSLRTALHYKWFTLPVDEEPVAGQNTWIDIGFELTDSLLAWCEENNIYLILDLHGAPGGQGGDRAISDYEPSKPSLWESEANRSKTVALWRKLAERYANEAFIGGYDLINEPNWTMSGNLQLKQLYQRISDTIRAVDTNHILFIEGNWFANEFTGLTPPWDDNMVYSFHKYWNANNTGAIQWMLDIRNEHNIPLWLGESGENSNQWFRDAIGLMESNDIGWSWWPEKKIASTTNPLSIKSTTGYAMVINKLKGQTVDISVEEASANMLEIAENAKLENCVYYPDVIDAMFRQVKENTAMPFKDHHIPGIIFAPDFDFGAVGIAYYDAEYQNTSGSSNGSWNNGGQYRNDGVDIQICEDNSSMDNGYNVGWIEDGEWMQYTVNITDTAAYDVSLNIASDNSGSGKLHFELDNEIVSNYLNTSYTGGWQNWDTLKLEDIILPKGKHQLRIVFDRDGFNFSGMKWYNKRNISEISFKGLSAHSSLLGDTVYLNLNRNIADEIPTAPSGLSIEINSDPATILNIESVADNPKSLAIIVSPRIDYNNVVTISSNSSTIESSVGQLLEDFTNMEVLNQSPVRYTIPAKIEAEDYFVNNGLEPETCEDTGGGIDMGYTNNGDYLEYRIHVPDSGSYTVEYRIASENGGRLELHLVDDDVEILHMLPVPNTGGWQSWRTISKIAELPEGNHTIRLYINQQTFNINWFRFSPYLESSVPKKLKKETLIYPNPANNVIYFNDIGKFGYVRIMDCTGKTLLEHKLNKESGHIDISELHEGIYFLQLFGNEIFNEKIQVMR